MASPIAGPPGSRKTAAATPDFSSRGTSRFTCVDFPQPSEPSNVISGMATILRQRRAIVEHPIFALLGWRQRGKFDLMTEAVAADFLPILAAETPRRSFVVSVHDVAPCTREASARIIEALKHAGVRTTSLLVVPNYHREGSATEDKNFVSWLRDLEARGYEIVIDGYFHEGPRRAGAGINEKLITQRYTQHEDDVFGLDDVEPFARLTRARED